jgi:autotransporter-associated beta strand protein
MRAHLLAIPVAAALLAPMPTQAQDATWGFMPNTSLYKDPSNWTPATVPTGTAFFGATTGPALTITGTTTTVGGWTFNSGAPAYFFAVGPGQLQFNGAGIVINAGSATPTIVTQNFGEVGFSGTSTAGSAPIVNNTGGLVGFAGTSTAGNASINSQGNLIFSGNATAGNATITNSFFLGFEGQSTAGNATVHTVRGSVQFTETASGGSARFITDAGGMFNAGKGSLGAAGPVTVGSIEGAGIYFIAGNQLTTGGNNLSTTVSGTIEGTGGSLVKTGSGTLTLSNSNSYNGPTTVNAGALIVNGSILPSSLTTVGSGATLAGTGMVGSTIINTGGRLAPGPADAPGTMTIIGLPGPANLAFQSGAIYLVQVNSTTASSVTVLERGTASLGGATVQAVFAPGIGNPAKSYTILRAGGGLGGTFNKDLQTTNLPVGFVASLSYTATDVMLNVTAALGGPQQATGLSSNHQSVAGAINNFFNDPPLPPAFLPLFSLTGANLTNALTLLSGEAATGAQQAGFQLTNQFLNIMLDPFVDGRSNVNNGSAIGFAPEREELPDDIALAYSKILKAPPKPANFEQPWSVWGAGYGGSNRTTGDAAVDGSHDLAASTAGGAAGLDYRLAPGTVVGFALAGGGTNWNLAQGIGGGKSDAFQAGLYGTARAGAAYVAAALAFTNHWMSTDRFAFAGDHLSASFNAQSYGGRVESGYRFATDYGGLTPYAAIQSQRFHTPGYSETDLNGGGFALGFDSRNATDTRSELGGRFDRLLLLNPEAAITLRARVAWAHDWVSDPTLVAMFQTLPGASFIVNGATPAKNSALVSEGAELRLANGVALLAKFDGEFASHSSTYAGTGTVRYTW